MPASHSPAAHATAAPAALAAVPASTLGPKALCGRFPAAKISSIIHRRVLLTGAAQPAQGIDECTYGKSAADLESEVLVDYQTGAKGSVSAATAALKNEFGQYGAFTVKPYASIGGTTYSWSIAIGGITAGGMFSVKGSTEYGVSFFEAPPLSTMASVMRLIVGAA